MLGLTHAMSSLKNNSKWYLWGLWAHFNIKMSSNQWHKSHCGIKTVIRSFYLHNGSLKLVRWLVPWYENYPSSVTHEHNIMLNSSIYHKRECLWLSLLQSSMSQMMAKQSFRITALYNTMKTELSWCQLCHHWHYHRLLSTSDDEVGINISFWWYRHFARLKTKGNHRVTGCCGIWVIY